MSTKRNRIKTDNVCDNRTYKILFINEYFPLYWDEGYNEYPLYRNGFKNPLKRIYRYKVREYRTWKYNRKTKYKS